MFVPPDRRFQPQFAATLLLFTVSGGVALLYEVFWMRSLLLVLGNTAQAAGVALGAFFLGLALGSHFWGARLDASNPGLRAYGWLEIGAALTATGYFLLPPVFRRLYPAIFDVFAGSPDVLTAAKFVFALSAFVPTAFLLGGTLPALGRWTRVSAGLSQGRIAALYAANTAGAAGGAALAGTVLPLWLGFQHAYLAAMAAGLAVGTAALWLSRHERLESRPEPAAAAFPLPSRWLVMAAFSGFTSLALQVLWTRMFAQTLQNSVQTFAVVLTVFLLCLGVGAAVGGRWGRSGRDVERAIYASCMAAALAIGAVPYVFFYWTDGLGYLGSNAGFADYLRRIFLSVAVVLGPAVLALGMLFPLILAHAERQSSQLPADIGRLTAANTLGAVTGALTAGFLLFEWVGLWSSVRLMAVLYCLAALEWSRRTGATVVQRLLPAAGIVLLVSLFDTARLPLVRVDPQGEDESLLSVQEDRTATVAVIRRGNERQLKVDNYYTLGGTGSAAEEALQGSLPVLLHSRPDSVYVLGLGTGITAGAVLRHPVERLVTAELLPGVIRAAAEFFSAESFGLFSDPRARVLAEDGRNYLAATAERFDVIIADLFVPWQAGAGSLYAQEHFQKVREHLRPGGLFMQWLPAYQLSEREFAIIARTLLTVFPDVSLWRGGFSPRTPVIGLLARAEPGPLSPEMLLLKSSQAEFGGPRLLSHYVGKLDDGRFAAFPVNTDDRPLIEFGAPITQRQAKTAPGTWLNGRPLQELTDSIGAVGDGVLAGLPERYRELPKAGACLYRALVARDEGYLREAEKAMDCYRQGISVTPP